MLFNDDLIFIHIGKTGGMSCAKYLLENLQPTIYNCHQFAGMEKLKQPTTDNQRSTVVPLRDTHRHWTLEQSLAYIKKFNGKELNNFKAVVAVIRNPVTLEYSFYNHMRKKHVREQRGSASQEIIELSDGPFVDFVKHAGYHSPGVSQDDFVRIDGEISEKVKLVKFESISPDFVTTVSPYVRADAERTLGKTNTTHYDKTAARSTLFQSLTDDAIEAIYNKHQYMFDSGLYSIEETERV